MARKKQYEAVYAGYVYEKPITHWTATEEVKKRLIKVNLSDLSELKSGGVPIIFDGQNVYIDDGDGHTALIACSGMKKSICGFMPLIRMLAAAKENMIITDPKGELYNREAGLLKHQAYNVRCLDFRTMDKDCFNMLHYPANVYRSGDKDRGLSLLSDIINALVEEQRHHAKDPFWPDTGALWLNGTGAIMMDAYPKIEQVNVLNWSDFNVRGSASIIEEHLLSMMPDNTVKSALKQCLSSAENTFRSILITASSFLTMFNQNPKLANMLSHSTFTLEDLIKPKTALFLVTDDTTSTADPVLGMIISQIQTFLVDKAYHNKNGRLNVRMNFVLDEFASIPIPNMDKSLATHRSRNIRYYLCVQSLALLKERYENPEKLLSNCVSTLYLGSTELELLKELEAKLGTTCVTVDGKERPLCSQAELMTLERTWSHKEAIYLNLAEGIRYCTMLPSIEAYNIGNHPLPTYSTKQPEIKTYTVAAFAADVLNERIRAPFAPAQKKKTTSREKSNKHVHSSANDDASDTDLEAELMKKYVELFGSCNAD